MDQQHDAAPTPGALLALTGSVVTLVALVLPWWDAGGASVNGFHDWGWLSFFALVVAAGLLLARVAGMVERLSLGDGAVWAISGGAELAGALAFWLGTRAHLAGSVRAGVFVAVAGGVVTALGGALHGDARGVEWRA